MEREDLGSGRVEPLPKTGWVEPVRVRHDTGRRTGHEPVVKTVLVPLDDSSVAERALGVAIWIAASFGADLRLLRASFKLDIRDEAEQLARLADRHGLHDAQVEVSTGRSAAPAVILASRRAVDSVVVMATHGRSGLGATLLGSVTDEVLRDLDEPMVLIGPGHEDRGDPTGIVVMWDGSLLSATVVPVVAAWARALQLHVRLLHVREPAVDSTEIGANPAEGSLPAQVISALSVEGRTVVVSEVDGADPAQAILEALAGAPSSLVALATRGRGGLTSSALGRVSAKVVRGCPHPILAYHPLA